MLVQKNVCTQAQIDRARSFQKEVGGRLPVILAKLGSVPERKLVEFFSDDQRLPIVDLDELILPVNLIRRVPKHILERHQILPVAWNQEAETLTVATFDPYDMEALEELQIAVECKVVINLATRSQIVRAINDFFYREGEPQLPEDGRKGTAAGGPADKETLSAWSQALIPVLLEKKVVSESELTDKARELGLLKK